MSVSFLLHRLINSLAKVTFASFYTYLVRNTEPNTDVLRTNKNLDSNEYTLIILYALSDFQVKLVVNFL